MCGSGGGTGGVGNKWCIVCGGGGTEKYVDGDVEFISV